MYDSGPRPTALSFLAVTLEWCESEEDHAHGLLGRIPAPPLEAKKPAFRRLPAPMAARDGS